MSDIVRAGAEMRFTRIFDAPRELVFQTWTDPRHFRAWWGPKGSDNGETLLDVRPGGEIFVKMRGPGFDHGMGGEFVEIDPPERLILFTKAFHNPDGSWKFVNHITVTFEALDSDSASSGGKTRMTVHCVVRTADEDMGVPTSGMEAGWTGSLDRLHDLLARLATTKETP